MTPQGIQLAIFVLEEAIKELPSLATDLVALFSTPDPTSDDWAALRAKIMARSYEDYVQKKDTPSQPP